MIDRIGMCTICAKVCHKGHDVSYAKYGSFFCDCGAKEDGSCKALSKRQSSSKNNQDGKYSSSKTGGSKTSGKSGALGGGGLSGGGQKSKRNKLASSSSSTTIKFDSNLKLSETGTGPTHNNVFGSSTNAESDFRIHLPSIDVLRRLVSQIKSNKAKQIEKFRNEIIEVARTKNLIKTTQKLIEQVLMPIARRLYDRSLLASNSLMARYYLSQVKSQAFELPDSLTLAIPKDSTQKPTDESGKLIFLF